MDVSWIYLAGIALGWGVLSPQGWRQVMEGGKNFDFPYLTNLKFTRPNK